MNLTGKTALITGASGGIGASIAQTFANAGAQVILGYRSNQTAALEVKLAIEHTKGTASLVQFDATCEAEVETAFAGLCTCPDILINNAGSFPLTELCQTSAQQWDEVQASNLRSAFLCSREMVKLWSAASSDGNIVNIASIATHLSQEMLTHYAAAKAGMLALSRNMAAEFGANGIRVNTVSPGLVWRKNLASDWPDGVARWNNTAPLGKVVQPVDVANACLFLASAHASSITGVELLIDAGMSVAYPF